MAHTRPDPTGIIQKTYGKHVNNSGGIFTPTTRKKLLALAKKPRSGARENEFWYDVRSQVRTAITDLAMICEIAADSQLEQMFDFLTESDYEYFRGAKIRRRADLRTFIRLLLDSHGKATIDKRERWRYALALNIAMHGMNYFKQKRGYDTTLFQRIFSDAELAMNFYHDMTFEPKKQQQISKDEPSPP